MPRLVNETFGVDDQRWLGSAHGIWNCRTVKLDLDEFTAQTHYPDGYLPSGIPLAIVDDVAVPYASGGSNGTNVLAGFLFTAQRVVAGQEDAVINVPLLDHGRVNVPLLPVPFTAPAAAENNHTTIVFVGNEGEGSV